MDKKLEDLLNKIGFAKKNFKYFTSAKIDKIIVKEKRKVWDIYLKNDITIPYDIANQFILQLKNYIKNDYNVYFICEKIDYDLITDYYENILKLCNNNNIYYDMFYNRLVKIENNYYIEIYNSVEQNLIKN